MGAVSFIETMDHTSLSNITQEEFEKYAPKHITSSLPETVVAGTLRMPSKHSQSRDRNPHHSSRPHLRQVHLLLQLSRTPQPLARPPIPFRYQLSHLHHLPQCTLAKNPRRHFPSQAWTHGGSSNVQEIRFPNH